MRTNFKGILENQHQRDSLAAALGAALSIQVQSTPTPQADDEAMRKLIREMKREMERERYRSQRKREYKDGVTIMLTDNQHKRLSLMAATTKHPDSLHFLGHVLDKVEVLILGNETQIALCDLVNPQVAPMAKEEELPL